MATVDERQCAVCGTKYRTKVKRGKDTKPCPGCRNPEKVRAVSESDGDGTLQEDIFKLIQSLSTASEAHLHPNARQLCLEYQDDMDLGLFLRDFQDVCVRYDWASRDVINLIAMTVARLPLESVEDQDARRQDLLDRFEP